ncbi:MAG: HAD family hydrolase [Bradymonadaceae bacterium]
MALPLIFLDLDGTLIGSGGGVSQPVWQALEEARAAGVVLAACTGRTGQGVARQIARRLDEDGLHIFDSGAVVTRLDDEPLTIQTLDTESLQSLVIHARSLAPTSTIELYTTDAIYVEHLSWRCLRHAEVLGLTVTELSLDSVIQTERVIRAHWIVPPEHLDRALELDLPSCQISVASSPALPESMFASITRSGVSKGSAARRLATESGIDLAQAMAIGDSTGDLPVLELVGHPRVMGDAPEELRERYPTLGTVEEDGVIAALLDATSAPP